MKKTLWIALGSFFLGILVATYIFVYSPDRNTQISASETVLSAASSAALYAAPSPPLKPELDFVKVAEKVGPAVVMIVAEKVERRPAFGFQDESPFGDFWDRFFGRPQEREREYRSAAQGTGFFISNDGYIMTNNHIVENATKVTITALQGEEYAAKVVGTDSKTDLALVKIEGKNFPAAEFGDSSQLKVGEWVLAIGNPLGMEHTVTAGIVSAKGRQLGTGMNVPDYQDFIQTDTAINRGNSGGPLVNLQGEVVGITSNILSPTGGNIGIGFAIPSSIARKVFVQLKEKGRVVRGYLGVTIINITDDEMKLLNLSSRKGALVNTVEANGPADKAGLKRYDVIVGINNLPVDDPNDLKFKIADIEPGTKVEIKVVRDGKDKTLTATITELEPEETRETSESTGKDIGLSVRALTPNLARRYGYETTEGLIITQVRSYSEAARKGLEAGDIILEVNRRSVGTVEDLEGVLRKAKSGDPIMLLVRREREGESQDFIVTLRIP